MNAQPKKQEDLLKFIQSLGDAERLKIAGLLGVEALGAVEVSQRLGMELSVVEQHLEQLVTASLAIKEGNIYRLDSSALEKLTRHVLAQSHPPAPEYEGDEFTVKTLRSYFSRDGALKAIPTQQKKLMVILEHLVENFKPGVQYPESQVNQILRKFHEDTAALRRYMVDNNLLKREKGIYWRVENK